MLKLTINKIKYRLFNKFSKDVLWLFGAQIVLMGSGLLLNILIGKKLGLSYLGYFNQILAFYLIFSTLFAFGLNNTVIKKVSSSSKEDKKVIITSSLILTSLFSLIGTIIFILFCANFPDIFSSQEVSDGLIVVFFAMPFFNFNKNCMAFQNAVRNQKKFSILRSLRWILILVYIVFGIKINMNFNDLLFAFLFAESFLLLINLLLLKEMITFSNNLRFKENILFGIKSYSAEILAVINGKLDILLIGYFLTANDVGLYSFIIFFAKALYVLPGVLQQNINPIISKLWEQGELKNLQQKMSQVRLVNLYFLILAATTILIFYPVLTSFYWTEFYEGYIFLVIMVFGVLPGASISWGGAILVMTGKLKENINRTMITMLFTLLATSIFSYAWELYGAAIVVGVNSVFSFAIMNSFVKRKTGLRLV